MTSSVFLAPNRDSAFRRGRMRGSTPTDYYTIPGVVLASSGGVRTLTAGRDYYTPFFSETPILVDQLAAEVTTPGGTNFRIGIYRADTNLQPTGGPLADSGNLDATGTGVKTYTPSAPAFLGRGRYLFVINADGGVELRTFTGVHPGHAFMVTTLGAAPQYQAAYVARAYAAFPTPGTAWDTAVGGASGGIGHMMVVRISAP